MDKSEYDEFGKIGGRLNNETIYHGVRPGDYKFPMHYF